ncbi:hypothetical protein ACFWOL_26180 [Streptomyces sp. NPDC058442]|uniref:hypothetical protein n=1 Tax=Streptomyces sp. NPDC058442 TaxID=3346503 RepID=UPI00364A41F7
MHVLDGDEQHTLFGTDPAPGRVRRAADVQRVGLVAEVLALNGVLALVAATTCLEVHVATGSDGADDPYAAPARCDLTLPAYRQSAEESVTELMNLLKRRELA